MDARGKKKALTITERMSSWVTLHGATVANTSLCENGIKLCPTAIWNKRVQSDKVWSVYYCTLPQALAFSNVNCQSLTASLSVSAKWFNAMKTTLDLQSRRKRVKRSDRDRETGRVGGGSLNPDNWQIWKPQSSESGYLLSETLFPSHAPSFISLLAPQLQLYLLLFTLLWEKKSLFQVALLEFSGGLRSFQFTQ